MTVTPAIPASRFASTSGASADTFRAEARAWARSQQQLVLLAADIDDSGIWITEGHTSAAAWITVEAQVETCTAREWIRTADSGSRRRTGTHRSQVQTATHQ